MKILSVFDPEFKSYGKVITGMEETVAEILAALEKTPLPEGVGYVPTEPILQELPAATEVSENLFGGMPAQLGWCNGHNTKLNCLEYHRGRWQAGHRQGQGLPRSRRHPHRVLRHHAALRPLPLRCQQGLPGAGCPALADQYRQARHQGPLPRG